MPSVSKPTVPKPKLDYESKKEVPQILIWHDIGISMTTDAATIVPTPTQYSEWNEPRDDVLHDADKPTTSVTTPIYQRRHKIMNQEKSRGTPFDAILARERIASRRLLSWRIKVPSKAKRWSWKLMPRIAAPVVSKLRPYQAIYRTKTSIRTVFGRMLAHQRWQSPRLVSQRRCVTQTEDRMSLRKPYDTLLYSHFERHDADTRFRIVRRRACTLLANQCRLLWRLSLRPRQPSLSHHASYASVCCK
jgi:hypothetical protein